MGVRATAEGIKQLKQAQSVHKTYDGKVWTLLDIANESGVEERTVGRFLRQESDVKETSARSICQALGVNFEDVIDQDTETTPDKTGQLSMNPFIYGDPVPPAKFYGRQQAKLEVKNRIGAIGQAHTS